MAAACLNESVRWEDYKNISEQKNTKDPLTGVSNFHSLSAPFENTTFSKKIKYRDKD